MGHAKQNDLDGTVLLDDLENQARSLVTALMLVPAIAPWPQDHYGAGMIYRKVRSTIDHSRLKLSLMSS